MMKSCNRFKWILAAGLLLGIFQAGHAQLQDENAATGESGNAAAFSVGADLVSRYIWRGTDYGNSPAVQPTVAFSVAGFKAGCWGSYSFGEYSKKINDSTTVGMGHYSEFDMFVSYTWKSFTLTAYDYFVPNSLSPNSGNKYYNWNSKTTGHALEMSILWAGTKKFPLQLFAGTVVYGADKDKDSTGVYGAGSGNNYSTYFEAAYLFDVKGIGVKPFVGAIPFGSAWYGTDAGVVNAGLTVSKSIRLSKEYAIPVFGSLITNPQAQSVFLVFGLSL